MSIASNMKRRRFLSTCGLAGTALLGAAIAAEAQPKPVANQPQLVPPRRRYRIDVAIVECKAGKCARHQVGETFTYPADRGRMCEWLLDSMNGAIRVLEFGGTLPWLYEDTPYKKVVDPDGVTTEFIRCPDPTASGVVAKITRTKV
jgi:uncharacterized repeat protein (TIGR04076 family)